MISTLICMFVSNNIFVVRRKKYSYDSEMGQALKCLEVLQAFMHKALVVVLKHFITLDRGLSNTFNYKCFVHFPCSIAGNMLELKGADLQTLIHLLLIDKELLSEKSFVIKCLCLNAVF